MGGNLQGKNPGNGVGPNLHRLFSLENVEDQRKHTKGHGKTTGMSRRGLSYERGGNARRKFGIKPLKETNLVVAQAFFGP